MQTGTKSFSFEMAANVPDGVEIQEIDGEAIILNLNTELYLGLNPSGSRILAELTRSETIEGAFETLLATYDVEPEKLRAAISEFLVELVDNGLIELSVP